VRAEESATQETHYYACGSWDNPTNDKRGVYGVIHACDVSVVKGSCISESVSVVFLKSPLHWIQVGLQKGVSQAGDTQGGRFLCMVLCMFGFSFHI